MDEDTPIGYDWNALAAGVVVGVFLTMIGAGILAEHSRRQWNREMARETALWVEAADQAYERGVVHGARLANPVQAAGLAQGR